MPEGQGTISSGIRWNEVTWYSRLAAIFLFLGVVPVLCFYIGLQYGFARQSLLTPTVQPVVNLRTPPHIATSTLALVVRKEQVILGNLGITLNSTDVAHGVADITFNPCASEMCLQNLQGSAPFTAKFQLDQQKTFFGASMVLSALTSDTATITMASNYVELTPQLQAADEKLLDTPTPTNFICSFGEVITIDSQDDFCLLDGSIMPFDPVDYPTICSTSSDRPDGIVYPDSHIFEYSRSPDSVANNLQSDLDTCVNSDGKTFFELYQQGEI